MPKPIASYTICNTGGVLIYEVTEDYVLAGMNNEEPKECRIVEDGFMLEELFVPFEECFRFY